MRPLALEVLQRVFDRRATAADLARLPALYRRAGGGFASRIATAGILRLALRWPGLTGFLIVAVLAARIMSRRRQRSDDIAPARSARPVV